ncbi:MAG: N-acetylneuraminate synthase [Cellulosilyticaceae bacterium]
MRKVMIIAEAGVNHNGDMKIAKELIDEACNVGADSIKFQSFSPRDLVTPYAEKANYQVLNTHNQSSQLEMLSDLALKEEQLKELLNYCKVKKIQFLCSPFDLKSVGIMERMKVETYKIPSGQITDYPYLKKVAGLRKKVILSTGMATIEEIRLALQILQQGCEDIKLLHCTSEYPTPFNEVNLNAMDTLKKKFGLGVGYSDHTVGTEVAIAAVAMGACIIEKHFTLDNHMAGPDHKASLEPEPFKSLVKAIRNIEVAMGDGVKIPTASEIKNRDKVRKSIVAKCAITKGECFSMKNLCTKRPGDGISPMLWEDMLGKYADRDYEENELIKL